MYHIPEQFTVKAQEPLILTWLYEMVASMEAAIFNCQCDQMQNCEVSCETIYKILVRIFLTMRLPSLTVSVTGCKTAKAVVKLFMKYCL